MRGLKYIWEYVKVYYIMLILTTGFILASTYLQIISPKILGEAFQKLIDYVAVATNSEQFSKSVISTKEGDFYDALFVLFLIYIGTFAMMFLQNVLMTEITGRSSNRMRINLFKKMENLSVRFFDKHSAGDLISRFTNDIDNISNALNQGIVQVIANIALLIGYVYMMYTESTVYASIISGMGVLALISSQFILLKARTTIEVQQKKLGELNGYIDERVSGQKEIIAYNLKEETLGKFETLNEEYRIASTKGQIYSGLLFPLINGFSIVTTALFILLGGYAVIKGDMSVAIFVAFVQYAQRFYQPLNQISSQYNLIQLAITGANRVVEIFDEKKEIVNPKAPKVLSHIEGNVNIEHVDFSYNPENPILKNINIDVNKGEMVALVGPTGSGKTTVMNLMNRFYDVDAGEVKFDGENIKNFDIASLRKNVGIVLQESVLFSGTIRENIAYGKEDASEEEIINAAKMANIHDFIMTLDEGYETYVTDSTSIFSTGQKQLMSIARTVLTNPDLLILDEATSNVDTVTEARIQKAMNNVLSGRTSFVIAHRLKTILNADKIIVLRDGEIIESGNHAELIRQNGFYAELYTNQFVFES